MMSRALSFAAVTLSVACLSAGAANAQVTNLEAGKSPSQIFAGTCNACHKSPRGLLRTVPASSLPGFLRQHYTTSSDMASVLSSYLVSNGANDTRYQAKQDPGKQGKDAKQEPRPAPDAKPGQSPDQLDRFGRRQRPPAAAQEASKPDADGIAPQQTESGRPGRNGKRTARPTDAPETTKPADGQTAEPAAPETKPEGKKRLGKRGRPSADEPLKSEDAVKRDTARTDNSKSDAAKGEGDKPDGIKPAGEDNKSETAKVDGGRDGAPSRPDPVPLVTPAPPPSAATASNPPAEKATASPSSTSEAPAAPSAPPPPVTASAPTAAPAPPATAPTGPPLPPISQ